MGMSKSDDNELRAAILTAFEASGLSRFEWARRADVDYSAVHGFAAGKRDMTLRSASRLCDVLGLELQPKRKRKK